MEKRLSVSLILFAAACGSSPSPHTADAAGVDAADAGADAAADAVPASWCAAGTQALPPSPSVCPTEPAAFSPDRPLGVGYPSGVDLLPPHVAFLTFDDGPSDWTGEFLDILASKNVHATFFVNAKNFKGQAGLNAMYVDAAGNPAVFRDVVKRALDEGHVIGNHTVDHADLAVATPENLQAELDDNERLIAQGVVRAGGAAPLLTFIRPPYGSPWFMRSPAPADPAAALVAVGNAVAARGINVLWTIDSSDSAEWGQGESFTRQPNQITPAAGAPTYADKIARIKATVLQDPSILQGQGAVILMHDTHNATRDALADIIDGLAAQGYTFGTLEDYVAWRWSKPSVALTPGPSLWDACVDENQWGCARPQPDGPSVCGRLWRAYQDLGGAAKLGDPLAAATRDPATGHWTQPFAQGTVTLAPEAAAPCQEQAHP